MIKWASLIFTAASILAWIMILLLIIDAVADNSKLTIEMMIAR